MQSNHYGSTNINNESPMEHDFTYVDNVLSHPSRLVGDLIQEGVFAQTPKVKQLISMNLTVLKHKIKPKRTIQNKVQRFAKFRKKECQQDILVKLKPLSLEHGKCEPKEEGCFVECGGQIELTSLKMKWNYILKFFLGNYK